MTTNDYPDDMSNHVRDPKIFKKNDKYYMVLGARDKEGIGMILLYESADLKNWTCKNSITTPQKFGYMWECPDYFKVEGRSVFAFSPQGIEAEEYRFANIYQSGYLADVRLPDTSQIRDIYKKFREWDLGFDFNAPQTLEAPDGRRNLFGWAGVSASPYDNEPSIREGWQHSKTVPRQLSWKGGILCQKPVRELDALGGEMGKVIDRTFIQSKMLNKSKGPAVHSLRAQADKAVYSRTMRRVLEAQENLEIK